MVVGRRVVTGLVVAQASGFFYVEEAPGSSSHVQNYLMQMKLRSCE